MFSPVRPPRSWSGSQNAIIEREREDPEEEKATGTTFSNQYHHGKSIFLHHLLNLNAVESTHQAVNISAVSWSLQSYHRVQVITRKQIIRLGPSLALSTWFMPAQALSILPAKFDCFPPPLPSLTASALAQATSLAPGWLWEPLASTSFCFRSTLQGTREIPSHLQRIPRAQNCQHAYAFLQDLASSTPAKPAVAIPTPSHSP